MLVECPKCGYAREVPDEKIPAKAVKATCPKCGEKFRFREIEPEFDIEPSIPAAAPTPEGAEEAERPAAPPMAESGSEPPPAPEPESAAGPDRQNHEDIWGRLESMGGSGETGERGSYAGRSSFGSEYFHEREEDEGPVTAEVPWERLDLHGFFGGIGRTIKRAMFQPAAFFSAMPLGRGLGRPLIFYLLMAEFQAVFQLIFQFLGIDLMSFSGQEAAAEPGSVAGLGAFGAAILIIYPIMFTISIFLFSAVMHLLLMIFNAASAGYEGTFRVLSYANAPAVLAVVPFLGPVVAGVWSLVLIFVGLRSIHATSYFKVVFAMILPFVMMVAFFAAIGLGTQGQAPTF